MIFDNKKITTTITRVAIFGSLSIILYMIPGLQFSLPFAPAFLKIHLDEIPILISGFSFGPTTAILILIIKSLFKLITDIPVNFGVGVLADFLYGLALVVPAALIYRKKSTFSGLLLGLFVGLVFNLYMSCSFGLYTIFPIYGFIYGNETIVSMFQVFNKNISSITDYRISLFFLLPFNLIKDGIVLIATIIIYKPMKIFLKSWQE